MKVGKSIRFCSEVDEAGNLHLVLLSKNDNNEEASTVAIFSLHTGKTKIIGSNIGEKGSIVEYASSEYIITKSQKRIDVWKMKDSPKEPVKTFIHNHRIVSARMQENQGTIAFSDSKGKILFWSFAGEDSNRVVSQCHWHASAVADFLISSNGTSFGFGTWSNE